MKIHIEHAGTGERWRVELEEGDLRQDHIVTVPGAAAVDLGYGPDEVSTLLRASFEFLLEREPPSAILRAFSIDDVGRYFGDYSAVVSRRPPRPG